VDTDIGPGRPISSRTKSTSPPSITRELAHSRSSGVDVATYRASVRPFAGYSTPGLCCSTQPLPSGSLKNAYAFQPLTAPVTAR
jgi:hypothetical protein